MGPAADGKIDAKRNPLLICFICFKWLADGGNLASQDGTLKVPKFFASHNGSHSSAGGGETNGGSGGAPLDLDALPELSEAQATRIRDRLDQQSQKRRETIA